jgi:hypothetical protein
VLLPDVRDYIMGVFYRLASPKCKTITMLPRITPARISPGSSGFAIQTFAGDYRRAVKLVDPMKSLENRGLAPGRAASAYVTDDRQFRAGSAELGSVDPMT